MPSSRSTSTAFLMGIPLPAMAEPFFRAQRTLFQGPKNPFAGPKEPTKLRDQVEQTKGYRSNPVHRTLLKTHQAEVNIGLSAHVPRQHTVEAFSHACKNYIYKYIYGSVGFNPNFW